jgi:hypothetical protein
MATTKLMKEETLTHVSDPNAIPFPEGPLWDRLGFELICGEDPEEVARVYGEPVETLKELNDLFWNGYSRSCWLDEAIDEHGLSPEEAVRLDNNALISLLREKRTRS